MRSMTGFGCGESENGLGKATVEIRTVNHRYHDMNLRLPQLMNCLEDRIRQYVSDRLLRGRSDIIVTFNNQSAAGTKIKVDKNLAIAYHRSLRQLSEELCIPEPRDVYKIAAFPGVITVESAAVDENELWTLVKQALDEALVRLLAMRDKEGTNICADLRERVEVIEKLTAEMTVCGEAAADNYRQNLMMKLKKVLDEAAPIDEARVVQECAVVAEKIDFTEEVVRLRSHFVQFADNLMSAGIAVGRKLDFIVQEMNREVNTIASKTNDARVTALVIEAKSEIEKIREQIQNIE